MNRKFLLTALGYAILGIALGIYMAKTQNHRQHVTHAHILLIGFVLSFAYAVIHKLWLDGVSGILPAIQFWAHQLGTAGVIIGLFLLYGDMAPEPVVGPILGIFSVAVLISVICMKIMVVRRPA